MTVQEQSCNKKIKKKSTYNLMNNFLLAACMHAKPIMFDVALRGTQCPLVPPTSNSDRVSLRRCAL